MKYAIYICLTILIISCQSTEQDLEFAPPTLTGNVDFSELVTRQAGSSIEKIYELGSSSGLQKFEIFQNGELLESENYDDAITASYIFSFIVPTNVDNGTILEFDFILTDNEGRQISEQLRLLVDVTFTAVPAVVKNTSVIKIRGQLNEDYTLEASNKYLVDSILSVSTNSILTIEAGTEVYFKTYDNDSNKEAKVSRLIITQGSKLIAIGTAEAPILFTSDKLLLDEEPSITDWGGVVLLGKAPTNQGVVPEGEFLYGGNEPDDNSGILRYIRSEYAGKNNNTDLNDAHAFKFFGVGSGTQIDHVQVYKNRNVAFRVKGGRVNMKYMSAIGHGGYGLWAGDGWQGNGQFWVFQTDIQATQNPNFWNIARSIEMRNDGGNFLLEPRTTFTISNVTCIGNGNGSTTDFGTRRGVRFRQGAVGVFQNAIITEFPNDGSRVEDLAPEELGDTMIFDNVRSFNNFLSNFNDDAEFFDNDPAYNVSSDPVSGISLTNFVGSETSTFNPVSLGSFFTSAPYIGAVESVANDWTSEGNWFKNLDGTIR